LAASIPHINAEPILLPVLIFSTFVDLQLGHLIVVCIGRPQLGHFSALSEICLAQSGQVVSGIVLLCLIINWYFIGLVAVQAFSSCTLPSNCAARFFISITLCAWAVLISQKKVLRFLEIIKK